MFNSGQFGFGRIRRQPLFFGRPPKKQPRGYKLLFWNWSAIRYRAPFWWVLSGLWCASQWIVPSRTAPDCL